MLSDKYRSEVSWNGYFLDVLKSGLQKYIRRGNLDKALYCAGELDLFKEAPERGETIRTNFLHRLMIIYMEDVANPSLFNEVDRLVTELFLERKKVNRNKEQEEELLGKLVYMLCKSEKARTCSHVRAVWNPKYKQIHNAYPEIKKSWSEVSETKTSLPELCALFEKYFKEKNELCIYYAFQIDISQDKLQTKYFRSNKPVWFIFNQLLVHGGNKDRVNKFIVWYKNHIGKMKEGFLCWLFPLLMSIGIIPEDGNVVEGTDTYKSNWNKNRFKEIIEIDDYVVDRHTRSGKEKGLVDFAMNEALVENEAKFVNQEWKQFYNAGKRMDEGVEEVALETNEYEFIVLTQITTAQTKQDVYFAKDKENGKLVVVKGPYSKKSQIDVFLRNQDWKKKNNVPFIPFVVKKMIPNLWPNGLPLGARNFIEKGHSAWFIVFDSVLAEEQIETKIHSSKLWPETKVVDWSKIPLHFDYKLKLSMKQIHDYTISLLFTYVIIFIYTKST